MTTGAPISSPSAASQRLAVGCGMPRRCGPGQVAFVGDGAQQRQSRRERGGQVLVCGHATHSFMNQTVE
jgi:hypothetical protein